jgi:hypothetical protein
MADQFSDTQIDKRVVSRYIRKGIVDEKEYAQHQKSLPDLADRAVEIESAMEDDLDDDADES